MPAQADIGQPRVAIWRHQWLPAGETFVRNHTSSLRRWQAVPFGVEREDSVLASPADVILFSPRERLHRKLFELKGWSPRVRRFLRDGHFDLVHAHQGFDAVEIAPVCRRLKLPLVVTLHGQDVTSGVQRGGWRGARYRRRLRRTLRQAVAVLAVSEEIAGRVRGLGIDPVRTHVLGVPLPSAVPQSGDHERGGHDWDIVLAARLVDKKGAFDLLHALVRLQEYGLPVRAAVAGDGPLAPQLEQYARTRDLSVTFLGFRTPEEIQQLMSRSALVAVPSKHAPDGDSEGLPTVVMEAAALGRPVVGYRHSGIAEAVADGDTGLLAPEGDVDRLSEYLRDLLQDPRRRAEMGEAARRKAEAEFDIDTQTRELEAIYDELMRKMEDERADPADGLVLRR